MSVAAAGTNVKVIKGKGKYELGGDELEDCDKAQINKVYGFFSNLVNFWESAERFFQQSRQEKVAALDSTFHPPQSPSHQH